MCFMIANVQLHFCSSYQFFEVCSFLNAKTCFGCSKFLDFSPREKVGCFRFLCSLRHKSQVLECVDSFQEERLEVSVLFVY